MIEDDMFAGSDGWKVFDVFSFYDAERDRITGKVIGLSQYENLKKFGIGLWYTRTHVADDNCKATNFACLEEIDREAMIDIVSQCMAWGIKPDIEEMMKLKSIPKEWIKGRINVLSDFFNRFYIKNQGIGEVVEFIDKNLVLDEGEEKISLRLMSGDTRKGSVFGEKTLYIEFRENTDLDSLINFKIEFALYLSELADDNHLDANTVVRKIVDLQNKTGKKYNYLIYDLKNLFNTNNSATVASEIVKAAHKRNIIVDFSKDSEDFEVQVYNLLYRKIYDFTSVKSYKESLRLIYDTYGENFYLNIRFRKYYPVKLSYLKGKDGEEEIYLEKRDSNLSSSLEDFNSEECSELVKISSELYKVLPDRLMDINCPYKLVSERYVLRGDSEIDNREQLIFFS